ncbi:hypothetical protein ACH5RR_016096 [Cinchona calisaya]|uniref:Uncharacterized protein n=1 Tax=Cinchona calisaya TaxID=153742 RepID=A0ABD2ZV18_9GENT
MEEVKDDQQIEIVYAKKHDHGDDKFGQISYVNQNLETMVQKIAQQMGMLTVAFIFLGIIFFHSIVQPTIRLRNKWWIPFSIFMSVSIVYWYTIERIIRNYILVRKEYGLTLDLVLNNGSTSSAGNEMEWMENSWFASFFILYRQNRYLFLLLLSMLAFNSLILFACYSLLHDAIS